MCLRWVNKPVVGFVSATILWFAHVGGIAINTCCPGFEKLVPDFGLEQSLVYTCST